MQKYWALLALLFIFGSSYALTAPVDLRFENVLPGGFSEITLPITSNESTAIILSTAGPAAKWIVVSPSQGYANANFPLKARVMVKPPAEALPGTYIAYVITDQPNSDSATGYIGPAQTTKVLIEVTQKQIIQAQVNSIEVFEQDGKIVGLADVENTGNLNITPKLSLELQDAQLSADTTDVEILPSRTATIETKLPANSLSSNVYTVKASVYVGNELLRQESIPVSLGKSSDGKLQNLQISSLEVGKPAIITAVFENTGANAVLAQLKANVKNDLQTEQVESDKVIVASGQTANLTTYFTTSASGNYEIRGYVIFDKSATAEQQINVEAQKAVPLSLSAISLLLFAVIGLVLFFVAKRPKRKLSTRGGRWHSPKKK